MRKISLLLSTILLVSGLWSRPAFTYDALAAGENANRSTDVSGGNAEAEGADSETAAGAASEDGQAAELSAEDEEWLAEARKELQSLVKDHTIMALVYLSDEIVIRSQPDETGSPVVSVPSGQQVHIQDVTVNEQNEVWEYVTALVQGTEYTGYVPRENLACSDEMFLAWEDQYGMNPAASIMMMTNSAGEKSYPDIEMFPESYRAALTALKEKHPLWTFVKFNTNLDWNEVVKNQMVKDRSLIPSSFPEYMWDRVHSPNWAYATEDSLKYYLDPRNGLTEEWIFQFEQLTYNEKYHTTEAVQKFLDNSFMKGVIPGLASHMTYAFTFHEIGAKLKVSPFHLASRVYQEQGRAGTSPMISGTYPGFEGYYNHFNVGASGKTNEEVYRTGLQTAKNRGWNSIYASLEGGATVVSANYIQRGQDTLYLQKFDVDSSSDGLYWHQYMQNICAPTSEGKNIRKLYAEAGSLENTFIFKIPVYNNMPAQACPKPTASYTVSLQAPEGYQEPVIYLDGVAYDAVKRDGNYYVDAPDGNAKTAVMYQYNESGVPVGMYVWELSHDNKKYTVTALPELENLLTYHGFSIRITGKSGIRCKTGIAAELRGRLTSSGVHGYTLKEYGTLLMTESNRDKLPMILGGQKVVKGMAYGKNEQGNPEDKVYETVDGRYRFTSVLVGLPVEQYNTEFAFRGYAVLSKNNSDVVIYGPPVARSIYDLAKRAIQNNQYPTDSSAYQFLQKLISDADAVTAPQQKPEEQPLQEQQAEEPQPQAGEEQPQEQQAEEPQSQT